MSPRAAWRLEALGFAPVYDYVAGKADWLAHALPIEGTHAAVLRAGDLLDTEPPTCALSEELAKAAATVERSRYGFCLVINDEHILLGRLRRSTMHDATANTTGRDRDGAGAEHCAARYARPRARRSPCVSAPQHCRGHHARRPPARRLRPAAAERALARG